MSSVTTGYEQDFYQWTRTQAALLRQGRLAEADAANIAEELESMGRSDRRALESYLDNVILHLLKWRYQPQRRRARWQVSINNGRHSIARLLEDSPSLKSQVATLIQEEYPLARRNAAVETGLPLTALPEQCPFDDEQIVSDYWPN